jgi:hypothetical protein
VSGKPVSRKLKVDIIKLLSKVSVLHNDGLLTEEVRKIHGMSLERSTESVDTVLPPSGPGLV